MRDFGRWHTKPAPISPCCWVPFSCSSLAQVAGHWMRFCSLIKSLRFMSKEKSRIGGLKELAALFLRLGFTAFGGPAAHIAMMEDEVVVRRRWMSREHFLDLVGATNLIPGPNSTEMAIHVGFHRAGWKGLLVAGVCFILPASLITLGFAWFYVQYGQVPQVAPFLFGIKPAVLAIIIAAVWRLGQSAAKSWQLAVIGLVVAGLAMSGVNEVLAILTGGIIGMAL